MLIVLNINVFDYTFFYIYDIINGMHYSVMHDVSNMFFKFIIYIHVSNLHIKLTIDIQEELLKKRDDVDEN